MRSAVDLPDPDGPTRTISSPSPIRRSSASTAGSSEPGYSLLASSNRTSAIVRAPGDRGDGGRRVDRLGQLAAGAGVCSAWCAELVEPEQRGADDRRLGDDAGDD